jgi:hypothetical protein
MIMKMRLFCICTALFAAFSSDAQTGAQVRGGVNLSNVTVSPNGGVDRANQLVNFQAGIIGDLSLGGTISFQPGLLVTGKGSKVENGTAGQAGYYKQTFNPLYLEVPANLVLKAPLGSTSKFFVGAGPYIAMGIGGKTKTEGTRLVTGNYSFERNITFSNDDPTTFNQEEGTGLGVVRRFDYGLNGTAGIEGKSMVLSVGYGLGMAKLQSGTDNGADNDNKHRVLSFTLGFKL